VTGVSCAVCRRSLYTLGAEVQVCDQMRGEIKATVLVFFSYSALRVKKSQGLTNHFLNLHRSRSYIEISVRNCFIFRSVGRFFCFCEKKLGTLIGRWHLGRCFLL